MQRPGTQTSAITLDKGKVRDLGRGTLEQSGTSRSVAIYSSASWEKDNEPALLLGKQGSPYEQTSPISPARLRVVLKITNTLPIHSTSNVRTSIYPVTKLLDDNLKVARVADPEYKSP